MSALPHLPETSTATATPSAGVPIASAAGSRLKILLCCHDNRCLGPMAEGWARRLRAARFDAVAAGIVTGERDPFAIRVMAESGIDIHRLPVRALRDLNNTHFDLVIALTDAARLALPPLPGDPRILALGMRVPDAAAVHRAGAPVSRAAHASQPARPDVARRIERYRVLRDEIRDFIETLPDALVPVNRRYYWVEPEFLQSAAARA